MGQKVFVRGTSPVGLPTYARAGRQWPTDKSVEVEVVDETEDPKGADGNPHPTKINKARLEQLHKDERISVRNDPESEANLQKELADLRRENADLKRQVAGGSGGETAVSAARAGDDDSRKRK